MTSTTIAGVCVLAPGGRPAGHAFDLGLSPDGIEIRRPGQALRHMPWSRVSEWDVEPRDGDVVLTLRGGGATTPLLVPGWSPGDLEALLRAVTAEPVATGGVEAEPATAAATEEAPAPSRRTRRRERRARTGAKAAITVALLVVLAAAVALVLLQSAGVIHWGFLGPTA